jgi:O-acetyl-ADP-ribose deacetylase (regulator of RNase III)
MIHQVQGSLFFYAPQVEAIVNFVDTEGSLGRGTSIELKQKYPMNYDAYITACKSKDCRIGHCFICRISDNNPKYIINLPIRHTWKEILRDAFISLSVKDMTRQILDIGIESLAVPNVAYLGTGGENITRHITDNLSRLLFTATYLL